MKNPFKKVALPVYIAPTPAQMMDRANNMVDNALNMFKQAVSAVDSANTILQESAQKNVEKAKALEVELAKVNSEREMADSTVKANLELKQKLSQFIKV